MFEFFRVAELYSSAYLATTIGMIWYALLSQSTFLEYYNASSPTPASSTSSTFLMLLSSPSSKSSSRADTCFHQMTSKLWSTSPDTPTSSKISNWKGSLASPYTSRSSAPRRGWPSPRSNGWSTSREETQWECRSSLSWPWSTTTLKNATKTHRRTTSTRSGTKSTTSNLSALLERNRILTILPRSFEIAIPISVNFSCQKASRTGWGGSFGVPSGSSERRSWSSTRISSPNYCPFMTPPPRTFFAPPSVSPYRYYFSTSSRISTVFRSWSSL